MFVTHVDFSVFRHAGSVYSGVQNLVNSGWSKFHRSEPNIFWFGLVSIFLSKFSVFLLVRFKLKKMIRILVSLVNSAISNQILFSSVQNSVKISTVWIFFIEKRGNRLLNQTKLKTNFLPN